VSSAADHKIRAQTVEDEQGFEKSGLTVLPSWVASRLPGATTKADLEIAAHAYQALKEDIETKVSRLRANSLL
ncbi:MAG: hypothetical protein OXI20_12380, partial [Rhodospirillales bacterium]|nr:hypothetical protein [Rhodospirillales bacterium]